MYRKIYIQIIVINLLLFFGEFSSSFIRHDIIPKRLIDNRPLPHFVNITIIKDVESDIDSYRRINSTSIIRRKNIFDEFKEFKNRGSHSSKYLI